MTPPAPSHPEGRKRIESRIAALPPMPTAVVSLLTGDPGSDAFLEAVLQMVSPQAALSTRLMAIANAPETATRHGTAESLSAAVQRVGTWRVARLIIMNVLLRVFPPAPEEMRKLWQHALITATAARELARASSRGTAPHSAYVAGLLHDVGRFMMAQEDVPDLARPEEEGWSGSAPLIETEQDNFALDHTEVGERICKAWSLPEDVISLVRLHHLMPPLPRSLPAKLLEMLRIVQQADRLSCLLLARPRFQELPPDLRLELLSSRCIHPNWDWTPADATHLDLMVGPVLARSDERIRAFGVSSQQFGMPGVGRSKPGPDGIKE